MSAAVSLPRIEARPLIAASVALMGFVALLQPLPAYAEEGSSVFGDVVVGRGMHEGEVSTVFGDATVRGPVAGDVHSAFGDVVVDARVGGNVNGGFGDVEVLAPVDGKVKAGFGDVYIDARVGGGVEVEHGDVHLGSNAEVMPPFRSGSGELREERGSVVHGPKAAGMMPDLGAARDDGLVGLIGWAFGAAGFAACAVLAAVVAPRSLTASARKAGEAPGRSLLVGLLSLPAVLVLSVVLAVSVVGVPLLLLLAPAYLALVFYGALVAAFAAGRKVVIATGRYRSGNTLAAVLGAVLVSATVLIPFIGEMILLTLALLGAGAATLALFSRRPPAHPSYEAFVRERQDA